MKILMIALLSGASFLAVSNVASASGTTHMRKMHHSMMHHHMARRTALKPANSSSENKQTLSGGQPGGDTLTGR